MSLVKKASVAFAKGTHIGAKVGIVAPQSEETTAGLFGLDAKPVLKA
jgi:hypothetical protein